MARSGMTGFEMGHLGELFSSTGTISVQSTIKRSGSYALRANPSAGTGYVRWLSRVAGGSGRSLFKSIRFYLRIASLPSGGSQIWQNHDGLTADNALTLNSDGTLTVGSSLAGTGDHATSTNALTADSQWHRIEVDIGWNAGIGRRVYVDGVEWASNGTAGNGDIAQTEMRLGAISSNSTCDLYFDDVLFDDASFATSGFPGAGNVLLLLPTADSSIGTGWTAGAGSGSNLFAAVDNVPPVGVADGSATNTSQIRNASTGSNLDYQATCQTYTVAGVPTGATVNAVMALCNDSEGVTTGTKAGGVWVVSNPTQSAPGNTFDYGDDTAAAGGTFPTGWATHCGPVSAAPSVTLGTSPVVAVRKTGSTNRATDVDFMGIYVDYTPAGAAPVGKIYSTLQAVRRSSIY